MGRRAGALFVVAAMVAVPVALAQVVLDHTVFRDGILPAGAARTQTVGCPRGSVAASGGVSSAGPAVVLLRAKPEGTGAYAFRIGNPGDQGRRVTVAVACRRLLARGSFFKLTPLTPKGLQVPARGQRTASLFCPASAAAAGAGFDLAPGRQAVSSFPGTRLSVRGI